MVLAFSALVPLPTWREAEEKKRLTAWLMVAQALVFAAIITAVAL